MEKLVEPKDYTPEISMAIVNIKYRMDFMAIDYIDEDIKVFKANDTVFVLGNPILGNEPIFDADGNFLGMIPMRNITLQYPEDWLVFNNDDVVIKYPKLRLLNSDLCKRITL